MGTAKVISCGYRCPVRGCKSKKSKLFKSAVSVAMHIRDIHGDAELIKRLRVKNKEYR